MNKPSLSCLSVCLSVCLLSVRLPPWERETHLRNRDEKTDERRKSGSKPSRDGLDFLMPACVPTTYMAWTRGNIDSSSCLFRGGAWISLPRISPPPAQGDTDTAAVLRAQREPVACIPGSLRQTRWRQGRLPLGWGLGIARHVDYNLGPSSSVSIWWWGRVCSTETCTCPTR